LRTEALSAGVLARGLPAVFFRLGLGAAALAAADFFLVTPLAVCRSLIGSAAELSGTVSFVFFELFAISFSLIGKPVRAEKNRCKWKSGRAWALSDLFER
jgi:hypothetical protein